VVFIREGRVVDTRAGSQALRDTYRAVIARSSA
jgi:hypothetical protein